MHKASCKGFHSWICSMPPLLHTAVEDRAMWLQKMEAVGPIIAHDLSNMFTVIMDSPNLLQASVWQGGLSI